ncbi:MAG: nitroreductase family protein [Bacteroidetes bacterium]|uniref:Nitroreductase family protein n=1 Tax=Candidatus Cryptobacteroides merdavium TaxID=2840769 RepID=A0A9D9EB25_9BACT|nr:nitroreductase family protein [Candidatus Cryptobacteroides merdavium]
MEFLDVIDKRHSVRKFADRPVEREILDALISVAQKAPSSRNCKSSAFMVVEERDTLAAISEMRDFGSAFVKDAPAAIVVMGDETKTDLWVDNCAISATFLQLAATAMDLGSCWVHVNGRPRSKSDASLGDAETYLRELLGIKDGMRVLCVVAVGYPEE